MSKEINIGHDWGDDVSRQFHWKAKEILDDHCLNRENYSEDIKKKQELIANARAVMRKYL